MPSKPRRARPRATSRWPTACWSRAARGGARGLRGWPAPSRRECGAALRQGAHAAEPEPSGGGGRRLRQALGLDPASADARFGLALQAVEAGDWDEAEALARRCSRPRPASNGWRRASRWVAASSRRRASARRARWPAALAPDQLAETALLLGEALDGLGRRAEAFPAFARGKSILRGFYAERAAPRERDRKLRASRGWFPTADPAPWRTAPPARHSGFRGHAFLVGFPRSGTTLLEQALAGHPASWRWRRRRRWPKPTTPSWPTPAGLARLARLTAAEAEHWRAVYWRAVPAHGVDPEGKVFLDKAPAGTLYLPLVAKLFPAAKVLFALRDPRDVALSCFRRASR